MREIVRPMRTRFYDPATRTFRPLCREALVYVALGPCAGALIAIALVVLP